MDSKHFCFKEKYCCCTQTNQTQQKHYSSVQIQHSVNRALVFFSNWFFFLFIFTLSPHHHFCIYLGFIWCFEMSGYNNIASKHCLFTYWIPADLNVACIVSHSIQLCVTLTVLWSTFGAFTCNRCHCLPSSFVSIEVHVVAHSFLFLAFVPYKCDVVATADIALSYMCHC